MHQSTSTKSAKFLKDSHISLATIFVYSLSLNPFKIIIGTINNQH